MAILSNTEVQRLSDTAVLNVSSSEHANTNEQTGLNEEWNYANQKPDAEQAAQIMSAVETLSAEDFVGIQTVLSINGMGSPKVSHQTSSTSSEAFLHLDPSQGFSLVRSPSTTLLIPTDHLKQAKISCKEISKESIPSPGLSPMVSEIIGIWCGKCFSCRSNCTVIACMNYPHCHILHIIYTALMNNQCKLSCVYIK